MTVRRCLLPVVLVATVLLPATVTSAAPSRQPAQPSANGAYIVVLHDGVRAPTAMMRTLEAARGFRAKHEFRLLKGFAADLSPAQVAQLRADPNVAIVTEDRPVRASQGFPITDGETVPPGLRRVVAATGQYARDPSGANVAVIDSGVDLGHPDLNAIHGINCVGSGPATDDNGHGTHVAGTIAARNDGAGVIGVAPGTRVVSVKVLNASGEGTWSRVICGIDWVASTLSDADPANDIRVANMSLSGLSTQVRSCATTTDPMHKAICKATAAGVTFVVAAGNEGWEFDHPSQPAVPAAYPEVLTVTAMADTDGAPGGTGAAPACWTGEADDRYAGFSNWASTAAGEAHTIAAPGTCIRSTTRGGGYATMSGTSMASPHVAAAVALCIDTGGEPGPCAGLAPAEVIARVRADAEAATAAASSYGFTGDPLRPAAGRRYGYLLRVGIEPPADPSDPGDAGSAPQITAVTPSSGASGQPTATSVSVTFDQPVNRVTAQAAFSLTRPNGSRVSGTFAWQDNTMTFRPSAALAQATVYRATIGTIARGANGMPLASRVEWTFRTLTSGTRSPIGTTVESRSVRAGGHARLAANDASFFEVNSTLRKTFTTSWYARFANVPRDALSLDVSYAGRNTRACSQVLQVWSWTSGSWIQLDARTVGKKKVLVNVGLAGTLSSYVSGSAATGELRVRVRCTSAIGSFYARADYMRLSFSRP